LRAEFQHETSRLVRSVVGILQPKSFVGRGILALRKTALVGERPAICIDQALLRHPDENYPKTSTESNSLLRGFITRVLQTSPETSELS